MRLAALTAAAVMLTAGTAQGAEYSPPPIPPDFDAEGTVAPSATPPAPASPRKVRRGAARRLQRRRLVRALRRQQNDVIAQAAGGRVELNRTCLPAPYVARRVAWVWLTPAVWWEYYCAGNGYANDHLAQWYDFYYWTSNYRWEYYGTWTHYDNGNCWYYWNATNFTPYTLC